MKNVSPKFAFRKLNEWRVQHRPLTFGPVGTFDEQGDTTTMFSGSSGTYVVTADEATGIVTLFGEGAIDLLGATFLFSDFTDSPFPENELGPEELESHIEATLPDGRVFLFAAEWDVGQSRKD